MAWRIVLLAIMGTGSAVKAQYLQIPNEVQEASDKELAKAKQRSDEAWQKETGNNVLANAIS